MRADFIDEIDWRRPWLRSLQPASEQVLQAADWREGLNAAAQSAGLCNHRGWPIRFVPQERLPAGVAYESFIDATACVPTRANAHDFFNALVWLTYPAIKGRLNALQAAEIFRSGEPAKPARGKLRDAATLFDENAAIVVTLDESWREALVERRWREAFLERRAAFDHTVAVFLFGHALMEKMVRPYKAITAHAWIVPATPAFFAMSQVDQCAWLDAAVARQLDEHLCTGDFTPLPILGVPGWSDAQDEEFYSDETVFRPKRR